MKRNKGCCAEPGMAAGACVWWAARGRTVYATEVWVKITNPEKKKKDIRQYHTCVRRRLSAYKRKNHAEAVPW